MSDKIMPMTEAVEGYELFDKAKVQKGFLPHHSLRSFVHGKANLYQWFSRRRNRTVFPQLGTGQL